MQNQWGKWLVTIQSSGGTESFVVESSQGNVLLLVAFIVAVKGWCQPKIQLKLQTENDQEASAMAAM